MTAGLPVSCVPGRDRHEASRGVRLVLEEHRNGQEGPGECGALVYELARVVLDIYRIGPSVRTHLKTPIFDESHGIFLRKYDKNG